MSDFNALEAVGTEAYYAAVQQHILRNIVDAYAIELDLQPIYENIESLMAEIKPYIPEELEGEFQAELADELQSLDSIRDAICEGCNQAIIKGHKVFWSKLVSDQNACEVNSMQWLMLEDHRIALSNAPRNALGVSNNPYVDDGLTMPLQEMENELQESRRRIRASAVSSVAMPGTMFNGSGAAKQPRERMDSDDEESFAPKKS